MTIIGITNGQGQESFVPISALSEGRWVKIALDGKEDGVYQITYSQLNKMGFSNPDNVGIYGFGGHMLSEDLYSEHTDDLPEIAAFHDNDGKRILFYGRGLISWEYNQESGYIHTQNPYAKRACYFVHEKEGSALSMQISANGSSAEMAVATSDTHLLHEEELINIGKTGRELYGESFMFNKSQLITFDEVLNAGEIHIMANVVALSQNATSFTFKHGGETIGTAELRGTTNAYTYAIESTLDETIELTTDEAPALRINFESDASARLAHLNYIRIDGKQDIKLVKDKTFMLFRNALSEDNLLKYEVGNNEAMIWDVSDPMNVRIQERDSDGSFTATDKGLKEYALIDAKGRSFPGIDIIGVVENQNLHGISGADMIIVTPTGLMKQAQELADFRKEHDGMKVVVVTDQEIYNEYSSGTADATAIRLLMKQVCPNYLLLFGDGLYDNRKIDGNQNYLISYESKNSLLETSSTVCDDYFGKIDGDDAEIAIGRIPVSTSADAEAVVKKIIAYSTNAHYGNWKNTLCFLSDDDKISDASTDSPNVHMRHNDKLIDNIENQQGHKEFVYKKIYLPAYSQSTIAAGTDYPDARKELMETLQQGALVVNYAGHGANNSITHEMLMTTARAAELNMKNLPLWITASCDISRWDNDEVSLGETLLLNSNGGAIALISTVRVVYTMQNLSLNMAIADNLFKRKADGSRYRLGDILMAAKQALGADYNKQNFCLLGDPAMTLAYPEYTLKVDEDGISVAGNIVSVKGRVLKPGTEDTAIAFNGLVYPTIYDTADTITADKGLYQEPAYRFTSRSRKIFSGRDVIRNGEFQFSFIVPKDISDKSTECLINLYACDESNNEGNGFFDNLTISKPANSGEDISGPEISKIFVNSADFKDGDFVGTTPYFFAEVHDDSGFNATGNSIGHDVTLTIVCTSNPLLTNKQYVLNSYLTTFTGDPTTGNVRYSIPKLEEGEYELTFKIWDSQNNSSSKTLHFVVNGKQKHKPVLVQAFPTPVRIGETVSFRVLHNLPASATTMRLQIYSQSGVKVLDTTMASSSADIHYPNGSDESSEFYGASIIKWQVNVAPGVYVYRAFLSSGDSEVSSESKLMMVY